MRKKYNCLRGQEMTEANNSAGDKKDTIQFSVKHMRIILTAFTLYVVFIGGFLLISCIRLVRDKNAEEGYWESNLKTDKTIENEVKKISEASDPVDVTVGTYITDLKDMSLDDSDFEVTAKVWFRWTGDEDLDMAHHFSVYKGVINNLTMLEDVHDKDSNYQLVLLDTTISKVFWTVRFPLESHQLRMYLQSDYDVSIVQFQDDTDASMVNPNMDVAGFRLERSATKAMNYKFDSSLGNPNAINDTGYMYVSEHMTQVEINRTGFSLYLLCFIAMFGTMTWTMITLYICTYHHVDPLGMIPSALFGAVANIMVGANMVPSVQAGLLLEMNVFGIVTILTTAITIIMINRIRSKYEDREFAGRFGRMMFITELTLVVAGNIALPLSAYKF